VTVSAYPESRALASVEQDEAVSEAFQDVDAATAAAYAAADAAIWPKLEPLMAENKAEVDAVLERFFTKMQPPA
jgi:serine/threonine protein kinase HipA of HipAB toxin-antitoxin module